MATIEIDQKWIDELEVLGNDVVTVVLGRNLLNWLRILFDGPKQTVGLVE